MKVNKRKWKKEEDDILIQNYQCLGLDGCAVLLNKSHDAVGSRATKVLNLKIDTKIRYKQKPFKNLETGEVFESTNDLKEKHPEFRVADVLACLNGKQKTSRGFHWVFLDEEH